MFHVPETARVTTGRLRTDVREGNFGHFDLESPENGWRLATIASDGLGWEHVSVHVYKNRGEVQRAPNWREMCYVKDLFWDENDVVIQFHPPKSEYVNFHQHVLHLWRPCGTNFPTPPPELIGPKNLRIDEQGKVVKL